MHPAVLLALALTNPDTMPVSRDARQAMVAVRTDAPPTIDGRLDDAAWAGAMMSDRFVQRLPDWGRPGTERTTVRVLYDADAMYVGVRAELTDPSILVAPLTRRDDSGGGDRVSVFIDSWHDRRTGFGFTVSAAGVQSDSYMFDDSQFDSVVGRDLGGRDQPRRQRLVGGVPDPVLATALRRRARHAHVRVQRGPHRGRTERGGALAARSPGRRRVRVALR